MDWYSGFLKTIKRQSLYYNIAFAIVSIFLLFLPLFLSTKNLEKYLKLLYGAKTAPLLKFNNQYYSIFLANAHDINDSRFSADKYKSCVNQMVSQLRMAIEDLKYDLKQVKSWDT